jgi:hypothetical protein
MAVLAVVLAITVITLGVALSRQSKSSSSTFGATPTADQVTKCLTDGRQYTPFKTKCILPRARSPTSFIVVGDLNR